MDKKQWKYAIGAGKLPVFLSLGMVILFGCLSFWLHRTGNGDSLFCDILTVIMLAVLIATTYRLFFYKVLIGQDGFFYQSQVGNGRYYSYASLRRAWISAGKDYGGHDSSYCSVETQEGKILRFPIYYPDQKAAQYLVKRTESASAHHNTDQDDRRHLYRIDGKTFGAGPLVAVFVIVIVMNIFNIPLLLHGGIETSFGAIGVGFSAYILIYTLLNHFFFLVIIEENGFYYQTNPFNGAFFPYQNIDRCWTVMKVYRRRRSTTRHHHFYMYFTDTAGKTRRFLYPDDIFHHEVQVLKERIERK